MIDKPLVTRYEGNPILTKHDIPYAVETVHNAGATKFNGQYILCSARTYVTDDRLSVSHGAMTVTNSR